ncbi:sigma-70 family RNA polymerase sigma factor [Oceanobacillus luteolus]|uniref:sigma-70 family RNA polymerase sigma factor n=1 Tax=Oceanobacillus luteolus TaxID=1274358 RepID=UPI00204015D6|nr:sigma-70 family RNA polymerase sigma factor [Oceanobacillus luteolus]MCM3740618.1 sigma-70 family RNA polymerase sigma factor [Oceanobacillus luteolus]
MKRNEEKIAEFFLKYRDKVQNPIIKGFLANEDNLSLLKKYILNPTDANKSKVDKAFKQHYNRVLKIKYVSNLIYFFTMDYNIKRRKENDTVLLILDKSSEYDARTPLKDLIEDKNEEKHTLNRNLLDDIESERLIKALQTLTEKQLLILDLIYHKQLTLKEISEILKTTPQNISNLHRKSLKKLNQILSEEVQSKYDKE